MKYVKKFILRGLLGITIGVFLNQMGYLFMALQGGTIEISSDIIISQFIISSLTGFYCAGSSAIFEVEEWSVLRQTITHFIALLPYFPVAIYAGWIPSTSFGKIIFVANYIVVYLVIWFSFRAYWRKKAKELNEELKRHNRKAGFEN